MTGRETLPDTQRNCSHSCLSRCCEKLPPANFVSSRGFEGSSCPISFPSNPPGAKRHGIYLLWWFFFFLKNKALFKKGMKDCDPSPFKETCEKYFSDPERRMHRFVWHPVGNYVWNIITTLICKCSYNFADRSDSIKSVALVYRFRHSQMRKDKHTYVHT